MLYTTIDTLGSFDNAVVAATGITMTALVVFTALRPFLRTKI